MPAELDADPVGMLRERLRQHPADRDPLQHATTQFHLGGVLLGRGQLADAEQSFTVAAGLFGARGARPEQAKALNGLGATLRAADRLELSARALEYAAAGLAAAGLTLDEGAARFNLGLVLREAGNAEGAASALARAVELLDPAQVLPQAAAAVRELGAARLALGDLNEAEASLVDAIALADRAGDHAGRGAAANTLGLVRLAAGEATAAAEAFQMAAAASPRALRPEAYAMAKANLSLACERAGAAADARLAARQALASPGPSDTVQAQARELLERLGSDRCDLRLVLESASAEGRSLVVREELLRSADADADERANDARSWLGAHTASSMEPVDVAELWLGGLLELPPDALERLVRDVLDAARGLDAEARDAFHEAVTRAMVRFHVPQWMRLQDVFSQAAIDVGDPASWR